MNTETIRPPETTGDPPGDKSPVYKTAPDQSGLVGFIQRCIVARKFISGRSWLISILLLSVLLAAPATTVLADHPTPGSVPLETVDYEQKLNAQVPLDLIFKDESGNPVQLSRYFGQRPVVLLFAYYECPMLCTLVLNNLTKTLKNLQFTPGNQFEIVTVSIDPYETPEMAAAKKAAYLQEYGRPGAERGWHFLTGAHEEIDRLAQSVGFRYAYDDQIDQYAHPAGIILLTPGGRVSRYILGIDTTPKDLRLGLVEAAEGKIGTAVDQFYLICYRYDPQNGRYTLVIENVLRLAGSATAIALGGLIFWLLRRERAAAQSKHDLDYPDRRPQHG